MAVSFSVEERLLYMTYVILFSYNRGIKLEYVKKIGTLLFLLILGLTIVSLPNFKTSADNPRDNLVIKGLVSNPLNLTYSELKTFPKISEIVSLQCVAAPSGTPYNWTGIPLFYLLDLAEVKPGAKEVVFRAEDGFSSSLTLDEAMHPTTILALKVNGTTLPYEEGYWTGGLAGGYPYRVIVPCKWGYKWVGWLDEIEVVDYDYKGTYESLGHSDEAIIPNCTRLPETIPAYAVVNATWRETYKVTVFSNATILDAGFNQKAKRIYFTISSNNNSKSLVYLIVPKRFLTTNFTVVSDNIELQNSIIQSEMNSFLYFTLSQGVHIIEIEGMLLADVTGTEGIQDGKVNIRDIAAVARCFGTEVGDPNYIARYDINLDGKIDINDISIAAKDFGKSVS